MNVSLVRANWLDGIGSDETSYPEEVTGSVSYGLQVHYTGYINGGDVDLQGSIDGTNWALLARVNVAHGSGPFDGYANANSSPVRYIRVKASGLSNPTDLVLSASVLAI